MKILITSGGTKIPIDRVRSITNMSKGTFGSRIADAFFNEGLKRFRNENEHDNSIEKITFFMAKGSKLPTLQCIIDETYEDTYRPTEYVEYSTFDDYKNGIEKLLTEEIYDIIVVAAAVSDYGVANYYNGKYRSREDDMCIKLVKLPKILPIMRKLAPNSVICGFKLLVDSTEDELVEAMRKQIEESDVDIVIGNDLRDIKADNHSLLVISKHDSNVRKYVQLPKDKRDKYSLVYPLAQNVVDECFVDGSDIKDSPFMSGDLVLVDLDDSSLSYYPHYWTSINDMLFSPDNIFMYLYYRTGCIADIRYCIGDSLEEIIIKMDLMGV